ncbi:unnamed protein product [Dicrocoelium dendriticum]|nr:unnamed protein product [Dicrocoelium dendriticum]
MIAYTVQPPAHVINRSEDDRDPDELVHNLRKLIAKSQVPASFVRPLLCLVQPWMPFLPKDYRTLMRTPRTSRIRVVSPGTYGHVGLLRGLQRACSAISLAADDTVDYQLHIDGFKPFNASKMHVWPILCRVIKPVITKPFIVGVYGGTSKPNDVDDYLYDAINEIRTL